MRDAGRKKKRGEERAEPVESVKRVSPKTQTHIHRSRPVTNSFSPLSVPLFVRPFLFHLYGFLHPSVVSLRLKVFFYWCGLKMDSMTASKKASTSMNSGF